MPVAPLRRCSECEGKAAGRCEHCLTPEELLALAETDPQGVLDNPLLPLFELSAPGYQARYRARLSLAWANCSGSLRLLSADNGYGAGSGYGNGYGNGYGKGYGYGNGDGNDSGNGDGDGNRDGHGEGDGNGDGDGDGGGGGDGYSSANSIGIGDGTGYGDGLLAIRDTKGVKYP